MKNEGWQRCAELLTTKISKVFFKNVKKLFSVVFCFKVGLYYWFYSEISHQRRCSERKNHHLKVLKVFNSEKEVQFLHIQMKRPSFSKIRFENMKTKQYKRG